MCSLDQRFPPGVCHSPQPLKAFALPLPHDNLVLVDSLHLLYQRLRSQPAVPVLNQLLVELLRHLQARKFQLHPLSLPQSDVEILYKMLDVEPGLEVSSKDARRVCTEGEASGCASRDCTEQLFQVETGSLRVDEALTHTNHVCAYGDLIGHLGVLPGPCGSQMRYALGETTEDGANTLQSFTVAPDKHCKRAVFGPHITSGDGSIKRLAPSIFG
mmetsp:Transcript_7975/g.24037  ORF Transcript_7975/g.24037 Transcript_7975/m.24037 type:complete len:215 (-) Transcript_7975:391-1035(-)